MASSILRSIFRCTIRGLNGSRSNCPKFLGSPINTVTNGRSLSSAAPWLMLPPTYEDSGNRFYKYLGMGGKMSHNFYNLADNKVMSVRKRSTIGLNILNLHLERWAILVGSSHGWLAFYRAEFNLDLFLYNPISHRHIKLPPVETIPLAEEKLRHCWGIPFKVILSCSPDDEDNDCRAILSFGPRSNMAFCCPGQSTKWTPFGSHFHENEKINEELEETRLVRAYDDFVYSNTQKQLFCITELFDFESWDLEDPMSPKLIWKKAGHDFENAEENYPCAAESEQEYELKYNLSDPCNYLVFAEHSNQLFLVQRHVMQHMAQDGSYVEPIDTGLFERSVLEDTVPYKTVSFHVHEIDREKGEFKYMDGTLDGMAFFIGSTGHGFVVESPDTVNLKPNSIYYTDPMGYTPSYWDKQNENTTYGGHDIGIFHYGKKTFSSCYYPCDIQKVTRIHPTPTWFTPSTSPSPVV